MQAATRATLQRLESVVWFNAVGCHDASNAIILSSWNEAIVQCTSQEWVDLLLEATNKYTEQLSVRSQQAYNSWNSKIAELKPVVTDLVGNKTSNVVAENDLPSGFVDVVNWDILHLCMEAEFADIYPPGFFASQGYWYAAGHFPCGWKGNFPNGTLMIY